MFRRRLVGAAVCCRRASSGVVARPPVARAAPASAQTLQDPHKRQYAAAGTACHPIGPSGAHAVRSVHSSAQYRCAGGVEVGASDEAAGSSSTHFGFQTVATGQKQSLVRQVFSRVATQYDLMNDVMSGGLHRWWKDEFVRRLGPFATGTRARVLDVAGGTGDTAFRIADLLCHHGVPREEVEGITVCDINEDMLAEGKRRYEAGSYSSRVQHLWPRLDFVQGDAQCLPFDDATMDVYTISFGIRNVTSVEAALSEAFRVLKPGGRFMCLEFSHVPNAALQAAYDLYSFQVIPQLGQLVAGDRDSYQYLVESIRRFPTQHQFATLIHEAGFRCVSYENFTGGIVAVHSGFKPLRAD